MYKNEKGAEPPAPNQLKREHSEVSPLAQQLQITFSSRSPINKDRLTGQNKRLLDYLATGKTIHCLHPVKYQLQVGYLNSRISDLSNIHGVNIYKRLIKVPDVTGNMVSVKEYSLFPFKLERSL